MELFRIYHSPTKTYCQSHKGTFDQNKQGALTLPKEKAQDVLGNIFKRRRSLDFKVYGCWRHTKIVPDSDNDILIVPA